MEDTNDRFLWVFLPSDEKVDHGSNDDNSMIFVGKRSDALNYFFGKFVLLFENVLDGTCDDEYEDTDLIFQNTVHEAWNASRLRKINLEDVGGLNEIVLSYKKEIKDLKKEIEHLEIEHLKMGS